MSQISRQDLHAAPDALNAGYNIVDALNDAAHSFTSPSLLDQLELTEECLNLEGASQEELKKKESVWRKLRANLGKKSKEHGSSQDLESMTSLADKVLEARAKVGTAKYMKMMRKIWEKAGRTRDEVCITYQDLEVEADALVGTGAIPSLLNSVKQVFDSCTPTTREDIFLINKTSGIIRPGRATLILGPPGAGKSLFMKLLSGRAAAKQHFRVKGDIRYNGEALENFIVERTAAYVDQEDNHLPSVTVLDTFQFSYDCLTARSSSEAQQMQSCLWSSALSSPAASAPHPLVMPLPASPPSQQQQPMLRAAIIDPFCPMHCALQETVDPATKKEFVENAVAAAKECVEIVKSRLGQTQAELETVTVDVSGGEEEGDGEAAPEAVQLLQQEGGSSVEEGAPGLPDCCKEDQAVFDQDLLEAIEQVIAVWEQAARHSDPAIFQVHVWLAMLGLTVCKDTIVGNALLRGISGGQRRRVTSGEFLVGGYPVLFLDEISTGLDSATTFSVSQQLCESCRVLGLTTVISLLQPPPETVDLFDDIMLFANGRLIYHGPNGKVLGFFKSLGFDCPLRKDKASFLQEVTTAIGQHEYANSALRASKGLLTDPNTISPLAPKLFGALLVSAEEMEVAFWKTETGQANRADFEAEVAKRKGAAKGQAEGIVHKKYAKSFMEQLPIVLSRQIKLLKGGRATTIGRLLQCIIMGIFSGLLYSALDKTAANSRSFLGVLFTMITFLAMGNSSQIVTILDGREVFFKQRDSFFFRSFNYVLSMTITQLPITALEVVFYMTPVYFLAGLSLNAANFFTLYVICFLTSCALASVFRSIASFAKDMVTANSMLGLIILMLILTSGFAIVKTAIPPWWIWIYWTSPFSWAWRAAAINEFLSDDPSWSATSPQSHPACSGAFCTVGEQVLLSYDIPLDKAWIAYGIIYEAVLFLLMVGVCSLGMETTKKPQQEATVSSDDQGTAAASLKLKQASDIARSVRSSGIAPKKEEDQMPFQPLTLVWKDIHYFVPFPQGKDAKKDTPEELELLKGITGYANPGTLTALMGGSGAGKTTFMDVIAGRKTVGRITGDIVVNGHAKEQATWARVCGYVEQMDIHIPYCTVREALEFSANLRLDPSISQAMNKKYVDEVMTMVDLWPIANRTIGTPGGEGLSLEQRKRVTIGVELVSNPGVIFMDEPTSGLDAKAAATVVRAVRNIGTSGRTIMVTIHQPSIEIFEAFDQLLLLQKGGYTIYFGTIGIESADLIAYYRAYQGVEPVPLGYNPATWMLEITGGAPQTLISAAPYNFADEWVVSETAKIIERECGEMNERLLEEASKVKVEGIYAQGFLGQFSELFWRSNLIYWRNPSYNLIRLTLAIVYAFLFGSLYWQQGNVAALAEANGGVLEFSTVSNILGVSYTGCIFLGLGNLITAIPVVSLGRSVFYRERSVSMYSVLPYAMAAGFIEIPYIIVQTLLFVPIMYAMLGFQFSNAAFIYWLIMYMFSLSNFTFFGQLLVYMTPSPMLAQVLAGAINFFWNIFSGFSIPYDMMPVYLAWINRVSPTTWVIYGLVVSQLGYDDTPVDFYGTLVPLNKFLEQSFGYSYDFRWFCILIVGCFAGVFMLSSAVALLKLNFNVR